jgi:hypothetical protein
VEIDEATGPNGGFPSQFKRQCLSTVQRGQQKVQTRARKGLAIAHPSLFLLFIPSFILLGPSFFPFLSSIHFSSTES